MFDNLFGWRKASKCKKLIMSVQCRIKLLKNKRSCLVRQLREDVSQLLRNGHQDFAFKLADQILKDESIVAVYELLDHFCEFITIHLSYIRRHKDCPNDINEAISSLIFASARCGDLPELRAIRKLFGERYGQKFAMSAVELYPGNLVNSQVKEKLSIKSVADEMKHRLVHEIARTNSLQHGSELQEEEMEEHETPASYIKEVNKKAIIPGDLSANKNKIMSGQCYSYEDSGIWSSTSSNSVVQHCFPRKAETVQKIFRPCSPIPVRSHGRIEAAALDQEKDAKSSSESSYQCPEEEVVYLDDIEELQSPKMEVEDSSCQDQRLFLFNSFHLPYEGGHSEGNKGQYDPLHKASSGRLKKTEKAVRKRLRKRSTVHHDYHQSVKDIEYEVYYDGSFNSSSDHSHRSREQRKHQKKVIKNAHHEGVESNFVTGKFRNDQLRSCSRELDADCSLEHPCYFSANDRKDEPETPHSRQNRTKTKSLVTIGATLPPNQSKKTERVRQSSGNLGTHGSCNGSVNSYWTKMAESPYQRAMTMPAERARDNCNENILRSNSFPQPNHLSHVHPKLPDYDELAAKFTALKKAHLQAKQTKQPTNTSFRA